MDRARLAGDRVVLDSRGKSCRPTAGRTGTCCKDSEQCANIWSPMTDLRTKILQSAQHDKFQWDQAIATLKDIKFWLVSAFSPTEIPLLIGSASKVFLWALMICVTSVVV